MPSAIRPAPMFEVIAELYVDVDPGACTCSHSKPWHSPKVAGRPCEKCPCRHYTAGPETIADFALAIEHSAHIAAGDGRLF